MSVYLQLVDIQTYHVKIILFLWQRAPCPPIESIMRLMTVWRITGKITRTAIIDIYMHNNNR